MGYSKDTWSSTTAANLRQQAERRLETKTEGSLASGSLEDMQRLVQELEVRQIELEMQNDELLRIQEELTDSRDKYTQLYDFAPIGYFTFDAGGVIREVNLSGAQLLGVERGALTGTPFRYHIADAAGKKVFSHHLKTVLQGHGMQRCEIDLVAKDGTRIHGQLQCAAVQTRGSKERYILASIVDGTPGKQLQTEIRKAREYAENIVETVREPLVVLDSHLKILTANHSFYQTFKVTAEDTIGNFIYDLGNRQWDIPKLRVLFEEILPHDTVFNGYEVEHDFIDIGRKIMLLNAREISSEESSAPVILLAIEDITERKLAEERIGEVMRHQQAILDNIPNIAWLKDKKGRYVTVNEPFGSALGEAPGDLVGKSDYDLYPRDVARQREKDSRTVMATRTRTYFEESALDREGVIKHLEKIETPIFNDKGSVIGIIGIAHDITGRKEVEASLRHDSTHDVLTGLYNRAFFDEELERAGESGMFPISIVMADVNCLKAVNDTLGHEAGDDLIRLAARIIQDGFRSKDVIARIGGDEFAILLPETAQDVAEEAVARIMRCQDIVAGHIGIAFGVASAENKEALAEAVKLGDQRMYRDKSEQKEG